MSNFIYTDIISSLLDPKLVDPCWCIQPLGFQKPDLQTVLYSLASLISFSNPLNSVNALLYYTNFLPWNSPSLLCLLYVLILSCPTEELRFSFIVQAITSLGLRPFSKGQTPPFLLMILAISPFLQTHSRQLKKSRKPLTILQRSL